MLEPPPRTPPDGTIGSRSANSFDGTGFPRSSWKLTGVVEGFDRIALDRRALQLDYTKPWEVLKFVKSEKLVILERKGY